MSCVFEFPCIFPTTHQAHHIVWPTVAHLPFGFFPTGTSRSVPQQRDTMFMQTSGFPSDLDSSPPFNVSGENTAASHLLLSWLYMGELLSYDIITTCPRVIQRSLVLIACPSPTVYSQQYRHSVCPCRAPRQIAPKAPASIGAIWPNVTFSTIRDSCLLTNSCSFH